MREGKTSTGFAFAFDERNADDMRFVELLGVVLDDKAEQLSQLVASAKLTEMLLGREQKEALYAHIAAQNEGRVPIQAVSTALGEILQASNETKNS